MRLQIYSPNGMQETFGILSNHGSSSVLHIGISPSGVTTPSVPNVPWFVCENLLSSRSNTETCFLAVVIRDNKLFWRWALRDY